MAEIIIKINKDGSKVEIEGQNFSDSKCGDFQEALIESIGQLEKDEKKPEFFVQSGINLNA